MGAERIQQMQDPELGIRQSLQDFKRLGYSDNWINQRLKSIEIRKDLTDQWKIHNVEEGEDYARLPLTLSIIPGQDLRLVNTSVSRGCIRKTFEIT